jgi:hypothetical protein
MNSFTCSLLCFTHPPCQTFITSGPEQKNNENVTVLFLQKERDQCQISETNIRIPTCFADLTLRKPSNNLITTIAIHC